MGNQFRLTVAAAAAVVAWPVFAQAQTVRTLCASGCTYTLTEANLQTAINASVGGDSILLQQGTTTDVALTLPSHSGASMVTIRTGVTSTGTLINSSQFPAVNIRMTPALATSSNLATLRAKTNNLPAIRTADAIGSGGYWTLKHLAVTSNQYGGEALIQLGNDSTSVQDSIADIPSNFVLEQMYIYGHPVYGQYRGIRTHANATTIRDSYIGNIKSNAEGQAIWGNSFSSGLTITNNYIEGGSEGFMAGGASGCCHPDITVASATNASTFTLSARTDLFVGLGISVANASGVEEWTRVASCGTSTAGAACTSNSITVSPALSATPSIGADVDWGIIPSDITVEKNIFYKPAAWRTAIVGTPQSVTAYTIAAGASGCAGGTLAAGTYHYRVVARHPIAVNGTATSAPSIEVSATLSGTGCIVVDWSAVTNAADYRVYGRSAGGQNMYWTVTSPTTIYTDTGSAGTTGTVPTGSGTVWHIKNIFELKNARRVTVNGNVFDGIWAAAQSGYAIVLTPANTGQGNDSTTVEDVTFTNNWIRNAAGVFQMVGRDVSTTPGGQMSDRMKRVTLQNNLASNIGTAWGASLRTILISTTGPQTFYPNNTESNGPLSLSIIHNTFVQTTGNASLWLDLHKGGALHPAENLVVRDNIFYKLGYGLTGGNACTQGAGCFTMHTSGASSWLKNITADAVCADYPGGTAQNFCPTSTQLQNEFQDFAADNFALKTASPYRNAGSDNTDIGANIGTITTLTNVALSGNNTGTTPVLPPSISTQTLAGGNRNSSYTADLVGVCPAPPCTWSATGLPTGVTLSSVSSTVGRIGPGTLTTAGTFNPTVTMTDSSGRTGSRSFVITVQEVITPTDPDPVDPDDPDAGVTPSNRPDRFNLDDRVHFGRATDPAVDGEPVRTGDLWADLSCSSPVAKFLRSTSPAIEWRALAFKPTLTVTTITNASATTYTAAELIGGLILRDPNGSNRSDVTPTATLILDAMPCPEVGDTFEFDIRNTADAAETVTLTAGTGVTLSGNMALAQNVSQRFRARVTNVETPAVTIYSAVPATGSGGGGGSGVSGFTFAIRADGSSYSATAGSITGASAQEIDPTFRHRVWLDLSNYTQVKVHAVQTAAAVTAELVLQYATTHGGSYSAVLVSVPLNTTANTYADSGWQTIPVGAQGAGGVWIRPVMTGGDATESPDVANIYISVK